MTDPRVGPPEGAPLPRRARVEQVMGLPVSIHVRGEAAAAPEVAAAVEEVYAELRRLDARFSTYRPDSEVSALRAGRLDAPSPLLAEVIDLCTTARTATGGAFDADLPGGFDPSGLVKGWAVQRAAAPLRALGTGKDLEDPSGTGLDWLVNAGGDVLLHAERGRTWTVGIEDPRDPAAVLQTIALGHGAVATSGRSRRGDHLVDPVTGRPARGLLQATVVGASLLWADVLATAAVVKGAAASTWLDGLSGYRALALVEDRARAGRPTGS